MPTPVAKILTAAAIGAVAVTTWSAAPANAAVPRTETVAVEHEEEDYGSDLGEIWNCVWAVGPIDCGTAKDAATDAEAATTEEVNWGTFPFDSMHNGLADGFRHCYWNALMTHRIGVEQAKAVADAHEDKPGQPPAERDMDLHNNQVGRNIGESSGSQENSRGVCVSAALNGSLKTLK
jgi:hypothetical protein